MWPLATRYLSSLCWVLHPGKVNFCWKWECLQPRTGGGYSGVWQLLGCECRCLPFRVWALCVHREAVTGRHRTQKERGEHYIFFLSGCQQHPSWSILAKAWAILISSELLGWYSVVWSVDDGHVTWQPTLWHGLSSQVLVLNAWGSFARSLRVPRLFLKIARMRRRRARVWSRAVAWIDVKWMTRVFDWEETQHSESVWTNEALCIPTNPFPLAIM